MMCASSRPWLAIVQDQHVQNKTKPFLACAVEKSLNHLYMLVAHKGRLPGDEACIKILYAAGELGTRYFLVVRWECGRGLVQHTPLVLVRLCKVRAQWVGMHLRACVCVCVRVYVCVFVCVITGLPLS
jgi:hypothetical protein